jgi:hypothetical protein
MSAMTANAASVPLKSWERWIYGGLGAMAPLAVVASTTDTVAVFSALTLLVSIAWLTKCVVLFAIGGFVAFLHKSEVDTWKCFVIGISAPALITTGLSGTAARVNSPGQPTALSFTSSAFAETKSATMNIKVVPITGLKESVGEQIQRGLFGIDPPVSLVVVSSEKSEAAARSIAGAIALYSQCPSVAKYIKAGEPIVYSDAKSDRFAVVVPFADRNQAGAYSRIIDRLTSGRQDAPAVLFTSQAKAAEALMSRIADYPGADSAMLDSLKATSERCGR